MNIWRGQTAGDKTGKWGLHLKTLSDTDISVDRLTVQLSGFSGWQAHVVEKFLLELAQG